MPTEWSRDLFGYEVVEGREAVAAFDGGDDSSAAGGLLLGATDRVINLVGTVRGVFGRRARPSAGSQGRVRWSPWSTDQVEHTGRGDGSATGVRHRAWLPRPVDHDRLRHDPVLAILAGKLTAKRKDCAPLPGKSTLNRLEHAPSEPARYHKIGHDGAAIEGCSSTSSSRRTRAARGDHSRSGRDR